MAEQLDNKELVSFQKMILANSAQVDAICQLLIEKGIISEAEFYKKLKVVMNEYQNNQSI